MRPATAEAVDADEHATGEALAVVAIAASVASLPTLARLDVAAFAALLAWVFGGWWLWAEATRFFGRSLFGGDASRYAMLRLTGFALAPLALGAWGPAAGLGLLWAFVAGTVATGRALRLSWWRAAIASGQGYLLFVAGLIIVTSLA